MRHPKVIEWEERLKKIFDKIDRELEAKHGGRYPLRPTRPEDGETANPEHSGLFNIGASFTGGFGSAHGPGYVIDVDMATLAEVPDDVEDRIEEEVAERLREELPKVFPGKDLEVERDGPRFKIHGNLSLGKA